MPSFLPAVITTVLFFTLQACSGEQASPEKQSHWRSLSTLENHSPNFFLKVKVKKAYVLGEEITLSVTSPKDGKLWVIYVDPEDQVSLLFPNYLATDNNIQANQTLKVPANRTWTMRAIEPAGQSMLTFIVTASKEPLFNLPIDNELVTEQVLNKLEAIPDWSISRHVVDVFDN